MKPAIDKLWEILDQVHVDLYDQVSAGIHLKIKEKLVNEIIAKAYPSMKEDDI